MNPSDALIPTYNALPTLNRFHYDTSPRRFVMGPFGSGKSVGMCMEILRLANMAPAAKDGVRYSKWAVVRRSYRQLKSLTLPTWTRWISPKWMPVTWGSPIVSKGRFHRWPDVNGQWDGTEVDLHVEFFPLDTQADLDNLLGGEYTGAWVNEARETDKEVIDALFGRLGRYPAKWILPEGVEGQRWLIGDTNPPDDDHWYYILAEKEKPEGWKFFRQPGAMIRLPNGDYVPNPEAENVQNHILGIKYWSDMIPGADEDYIKVYVLGEYGSLFTGRPVYDGVWSEEIHLSKVPLGVFKGLPIRLGWDYGLQPACAIWQLSPSGQVRILREAYAEYSDLKQFALEVVKPLLANDFPGMSIISHGDPAGGTKAQTDGLTCEQILSLPIDQGGCGIPTTSAPTQEWAVRKGCVVNAMTRLIGGQPGFILDPSCHHFRKGFNGGYQFSRILVAGGETRYKDTPLKNIYSHLQDALQYAISATEELNPSMASGQVRVTNVRKGVAVWAGAV